MRNQVVYAKVMVITEFGNWCLNEIRGLKEGTIIKGRYCEAARSVDFKFNGKDATLWRMQNCIILTKEEMKRNYPKEYNRLKNMPA